MARQRQEARNDTYANFSKSLPEECPTFCKPCDQKGIRVSGFGLCMSCKEHLCEHCFYHHKNHSKFHMLLDKFNMPKTFKVQFKDEQYEELVTPCSDHTKEKIKFYCHDHDKLLCSVCTTLDHPRNSCKVKYIPDISQQSLNSKNLVDILQKMDEVIEQCKEISNDARTKINISNPSLADVLADIKMFRLQINQRLDEIEDEVGRKMNVIEMKNDSNLKTVETICSDVEAMLTTSSDLIKQLNDTKRADRLFVELKAAERLVLEGKKSLTQLRSYRKCREYRFKPNQELLDNIQKENSIGNISAIFHQDTIDIKTPSDRYKCWITGMSFLTHSKFLLADSGNTSVTLMDLETKSMIHQRQLQTAPWDIASVTAGQAIVTLPNEKALQFVSTPSNKLSLKQKIKVDGECYGISHCQEKLIVSFCYPGRVKILNMKGKVLSEIKARCENIFNLPFYVTSNNQHIFVSDTGKQIITRFNWNGVNTGCYTDQGSYRGVSLSPDGDLFVCNHGTDTILHISHDLSRGSAILKSVAMPIAVCWNDANKQLYISNDSTKHNLNSIQCFKMI